MSEAVYTLAVLACPFLLGIAVGRSIKIGAMIQPTNTADEVLGRRVRLAVEDVRFKSRFVNEDFQVIFRGDLKVAADDASYSIQITRRAA